MRVTAGSIPVVTTSGVVLNCDQWLSVVQADLVLRVIEKHGMTPDDCTAVEIDEGGWRIELCPIKHPVVPLHVP